MKTENRAINSLKVYPNPVGENVNIKSSVTINSIKIYNFFGQCIFSDYLNSMTSVVNTERFFSATYLILIETNEGKKSGKNI